MQRVSLDFQRKSQVINRPVWSPRLCASARAPGLGPQRISRYPLNQGVLAKRRRGAENQPQPSRQYERGKPPRNSRANNPRVLSILSNNRSDRFEASSLSFAASRLRVMPPLVWPGVRKLPERSHAKTRRIEG
jgi:hypothetical protein